MTGHTSAKGTILVTGGAGFIGSHTCVELLNVGYGVVVIDNLVNSNAQALKRVEQITGKKLAFYEADVRDESPSPAFSINTPSPARSISPR
jgi:UDP-glucose 4-epimerase